ncbi:transketolase [Patescibacteria group bacterium]
MKKLNEKQLALKANEIRQSIIKMLLKAGTGHSAGPLGMADVFTALYFNVLNHKPKQPDWPERDRVILSNGHICPVLYAAMGHAGYFPLEEFKTLRQLGTRLQGHPHREILPGLESTSGPLGSGLSQAAGMAAIGKMQKKTWRAWCLMSDGELDEGNTWEGLMFAAKYKLDNITAVIDRNNIQIDGKTEDVMPLEPLAQKFASFNWHVIEVDGHNYEDIIDAMNYSKTIAEQPTMIIAHTIPGKGVSFMENDYKWHGIPPDKDQAKKALDELRAERSIIQKSYNQ